MSSPSSSRATAAMKRHVLIIEDNAPDALLAELVHDEVRHCSTLDIVNTGAAALRYLRREGEFADRERPDLILLDLKMPGESGFDLLTAIRRIEGFELIPIVVCSGSIYPPDARKAYELGANAVIHKPADLKEFFRVLGACYEFWCTASVLPSN